jgi:hypothetical protein
MGSVRGSGQGMCDYTTALDSGGVRRGDSEQGSRDRASSQAGVWC